MPVTKSRAVAALVTVVLLCAGCASTSTTGDSRPMSPAQMKQQQSKTS